jgi:hypothetical protein
MFGHAPRSHCPCEIHTSTVVNSDPNNVTLKAIWFCKRRSLCGFEIPLIQIVRGQRISSLVESYRYPLSQASQSRLVVTSDI